MSIKKVVRDANIRLTSLTNQIFKLKDEELLAYVQAGMPGISNVPELFPTREQLLLAAVQWAIDQALPMD